jgi:hypothetical protein
MLFKLPNIEEYLRGALTVACELKQYFEDNAESMLKATTPHDIAAFSNNVLLHEVELSCPFWMSCLRGACNPGKNPKKTNINSMALNTAIAARCRNHSATSSALQ